MQYFARSVSGGLSANTVRADGTALRRRIGFGLLNKQPVRASSTAGDSFRVVHKPIFAGILIDGALAVRSPYSPVGLVRMCPGSRASLRCRWMMGFGVSCAFIALFGVDGGTTRRVVDFLLCYCYQFELKAGERFFFRLVTTG